MLDFVVDTSEVLRKVHNDLKTTLRAWAKFSGPNGDILYLLDVNQISNVHRLASISRSLEGLSDLTKEIGTMEKTLEKAEKIVSLPSLFRPNTALTPDQACVVHELNRQSESLGNAGISP